MLACSCKHEDLYSQLAVGLSPGLATSVPGMMVGKMTSGPQFPIHETGITVLVLAFARWYEDQPNQNVLSACLQSLHTGTSPRRQEMWAPVGQLIWESQGCYWSPRSVVGVSCEAECGESLLETGGLSCWIEVTSSIQPPRTQFLPRPCLPVTCHGVLCPGASTRPLPDWTHIFKGGCRGLEKQELFLPVFCSGVAEAPGAAPAPGPGRRASVSHSSQSCR